MSRVYNPCRVVAQAPAGGCGEQRGLSELKGSSSGGGIMWLCAGEVPGAAPRPSGSHRFCFHPFVRLSPLPFSLSPPHILPFISATVHLHCLLPLQWPGLLLLFWFIIGLFISLLVTHTIYLRFPTPVSPPVNRLFFPSPDLSLHQMGHLLTITRFPSPSSPSLLTTLSLFSLRSKRSWDEGAGKTECMSLHLGCLGDVHLLNKRKILSGSLQLSEEINALNGQFNNLERAGSVGSR